MGRGSPLRSVAGLGCLGGVLAGAAVLVQRLGGSRGRGCLALLSWVAGLLQQSRSAAKLQVMWPPTDCCQRCLGGAATCWGAQRGGAAPSCGHRAAGLGDQRAAAAAAAAAGQHAAAISNASMLRLQPGQQVASLSPLPAACRREGLEMETQGSAKLRIGATRGSRHLLPCSWRAEL